MPGLNLTRAEAAQRTDLITVNSYAIDLELTGIGDTFRSTTIVTFRAAHEGARTFVDLDAPAVHEVTLNGVSLDPASVYHDGRIAIGPLAADNELRVVAACAYMNTGEGLHRSVDPADGNTYLYTHFEIPEARRVFATFEQPDLRAPFTFTVTAPADWLVLSNSPTPDPQPLGDGLAVWRFEKTPPISTYITAIAAGPYHLVRDAYTAKSGQTVPLGVACRASLAAYLDEHEIFEVTKQGFDYYLEAFEQPYPFAKYDQIFVPEYNIGAMENVGLVTIREKYLFQSQVTESERQVRARTILHELAHMWFGDLVAVAWWDDLWLKESFATYIATLCQAEATRWTGAWTAFASVDKAWGLAQDELPSTHPIVATISDLEDVQLNFDGITYAKGAAVLKQLVAWVGRDAFLAGLRDYFTRYAWSAAALGDLLGALEASSGRDLRAWAGEWLQATGPNTLTPSIEVDADGTITSFAVLQDGETPRSHRVAIGTYERVDSAIRRTARIELDVAGPRTEVPELSGVPRPDLVLVNDDDLTFAALRLDEVSMSTVLSSIEDIADPLARALCWGATWEMVRDAELAASDFIGLVLRAIGHETDLRSIRTLHSRLLIALDELTDPTRRPAVCAAVADVARHELEATAGDVQRAWAELFARTTDDLDLVRALRSGDARPSGLVVDTKLRWALFAALVRAGAVGEAEIDAELADDHTLSGAQYAAGARAALPTAAAKRWAWQAVVERDDLPNRTQDSVIGGLANSDIGVGFVQPDQLELTEPYIDAYFETVPYLWRERTPEITRNLITGLYPRLHASRAMLARTDEVVATGELPPPVQRLLIEERADAERLLRARERDRAGSWPRS